LNDPGLARPVRVGIGSPERNEQVTMSVPRFRFPVVAGAMALAVPLDAWAYLDPGTGSYLFQLAVAGLFAGMMTIKIYFERIKNWFRSFRAPPTPPTGAQPGADDRTAP
jgi:hypothetical protein